MPVRDLNRAMDWNIPDDEATTIAGVVIHEARSIPEPGQSFTFHGFRFHVLRKTRNRITALRVAPLARKVTAEGKLAPHHRDSRTRPTTGRAKTMANGTYETVKIERDTAPMPASPGSSSTGRKSAMR